MHLRFSLDASDCRQWLLGFAHKIRAAGHEISFDIRPGGASLGWGVERLLQVERKLFHLQGLSPLAPLPEKALQELAVPSDVGAPELVFELSGAQQGDFSLRVSSRPGIAQLPATLMARAPFGLSLHTPDGAIAAQAVPSVFDPDSLWRSTEVATTRLATLILRVLDRDHPLQQVQALPSQQRAGALGFFLGSFRRKALARLWPHHHRADHWRIGIRRRRVRDEMPPPTLEGFEWIDDGGDAYLADPALVEHEERTYLFMERYCYHRNLGELAVVELDDEGKARGLPRTIVQREGHLSFPVVFACEGELYLTAENAGEGHVPLYRAKLFPDVWEELPPLIEQPIHDPLMFRQGHDFFMLGNMELGGSSCDAAVAFRASSPLGPYAPVAGNPLLLDARFARAGGLMFYAGGKRIRVMQDCCTSYGAFLRFAPFEGLDEGAMRLGPASEWHPPGGHRIAGMHTYTRSTRFEAIDILTPRVWKGL